METENREARKKEAAQYSPGKYVLAVFLSGMLLFAACTGQQPRVIFQPEILPETLPVFERPEIIESQNGGPEMPLPEWVNRFLGEGIRGVESMEKYLDKYVFIGENKGNSFNAMRQWARFFSVEQDLPRLVAARIEKKLVSAAALYPDDEYGAFFETVVKVSGGEEYPGAIKEESFWIKRKAEEAAEDSVQGDNLFLQESYEFFVLISVDRAVMQNRIRDIIENITPAIPPAREQAAAINRVKQNFFEDF